MFIMKMDEPGKLACFGEASLIFCWGIDYANGDFSWIFSVPPGKCKDSALN
jgi:hypothetical protein